MKKQTLGIGTIEKRYEDSRRAYFEDELEVLDGIDISDGEKPGASSLSETEIKKLRASEPGALVNILEGVGVTVEVVDESGEGDEIAVRIDEQ